MHAVESPAPGQGPGGGAGGDHDAVGPDRPAVGEPYVVLGPRPGVEPDGPRTEFPDGREVLALGFEGERVLVDLPGEELLRQRGPVVRAVGFVADEDEAPVVPLLAQ